MARLQKALDDGNTARMQQTKQQERQEEKIRLNFYYFFSKQKLKYDTSNT